MSRLERLPLFAEEGVGLEDFRAIYDVVQCVCFRPHRTTRAYSFGQGGNQVDSKDTKFFERKRKRSDSRSSSPSYSPLSVEEAKAQGKIRLPLSFPTSDGHRDVIDTIRSAYESASLRDQKSWNVENDGNNENRESPKCPSEFLSSTNIPGKIESEKKPGTANTDGYCSFILQDDSNNAVSSFAKRMETLVAEGGKTTNPSTRMMFPHSLLLTSTKHSLADCVKDRNDTEKIGNAKNIRPRLTVAPHYWIFVGRNFKQRESGDWLSGRKEHTDSIEHDGTFHHQILGRKLWKLRPTLELRERCDRDHDLALLDSYEVLVEEGDVFVINTKLWWHQTEIPPGWSVSYARDLYLDGKGTDSISNGATNREPGEHHWDGSGDSDGFGDESDLETDAADPPAQKGVGNVEVSWASGFIPMGTTLVVGNVTEGDEDFDDCINTDRDDCECEYNCEDDIATFYDHLVPPTIQRTRLTSRANCKLVLLPSEPETNGHAFDSKQDGEEATRKDSCCSEESTRQKPRLRQIALEMIKDIREGEEFVMLLKKKELRNP